MINTFPFKVRQNVKNVIKLYHNEENSRSEFKMVSIFFIRERITILSIFVVKKNKQFSRPGQIVIQRKPCIDRFMFEHQKSNSLKCFVTFKYEISLSCAYCMLNSQSNRFLVQTETISIVWSLLVLGFRFSSFKFN